MLNQPLSSSQHILIIDNDDRWLNSIEKILKAPGRRFYKAKDEQDAVSLLQVDLRSGCDIIISNISLKSDLGDFAIDRLEWLLMLEYLIDMVGGGITTHWIIVSGYPQDKLNMLVSDFKRDFYSYIKSIDVLYKEAISTTQLRQKVNWMLIDRQVKYPPLSLTDSAIVQIIMMLNDLPDWQSGNLAQWNTILTLAKLPSLFIENLPSTNMDYRAYANIVVKTLNPPQYGLEDPDYTTLGLLMKYLYNRALSINIRCDCCKIILVYHLTKDKEFIQICIDFLHQHGGL